MSKVFNVLSIARRSISLSALREGKRNFRKFPIPNKLGSRLHKLRQGTDDPELPIDHRGVRPIGYKLAGSNVFVKIPEMIPDIIVPDLTNCNLKPYVSYRAPDVIQSEFTAEQLFGAVYSDKIMSDFKEGKLGENGLPLSPSEDERLEPEEAVARARKTGSDIF